MSGRRSRPLVIAGAAEGHERRSTSRRRVRGPQRGSRGGVRVSAAAGRSDRWATHGRAYGQTKTALAAQEVALPVLNLLLDRFLGGQASAQHFAHESRHLGVAREAERDELLTCQIVHASL